MQCEHTTRPVKAKGLCGSCYNKNLFEKATPEQQQLRLDRIKENWSKRDASKNSEAHALKQRNRALKHRYGISEVEYQQMLLEQNNCCFLCKGKQRGLKPLFVDHNHSTGVTRKLLCSRCNTFVGYVETNKNLLPALELYLKEQDAIHQSGSN